MATAQTTTYATPAADEPEAAVRIPGLAYHEAFLNPDECDALLAIASRQAWSTQLKRRVQQYGYAYSYKRRGRAAAQRIGPLPDWLGGVATAIGPFFERGESIQQVIVNEYLPGQGIAGHIDHPECFGQTVAILSLGSMVVMEFKQSDTSQVSHVALQPGSLLVLRRDARYKWRHGVPSRKTDRVDGAVIRRGRRVSLTFRSVRTNG